MIDCFDLLYEEGAERPKIMSVALHDRLIGRPGRAVGLIKFLDYARRHDRVWFCTGRDIAEHWHREHPPPTSGGTIARCRNSEIPLTAAAQFALIEIALFILGTPTDLKEMLPDTSSQQAEPAPSFHQY